MLKVVTLKALPVWAAWTIKMTRPATARPKPMPWTTADRTLSTIKYFFERSETGCQRFFVISQKFLSFKSISLIFL